MKLKRALSFLFSLFTVIYFEAILRIFTIGAFDESFITDRYMFNAVDNRVVMTGDEQVADEEIERAKKIVHDRMLISKYLIDSDYYRYIVDYIAEANKVK